MKKGILTGILLFGIFFGAGNLIFPPALGVNSGENFWPAILGFVVSGVGIAIITLIVGTLNPNGYGAELDEKVSPLYSTVYLVLLYASIGPLFAIPRTAATAFDIGVEPLVKNSTLPWLLIFTIIYFGCAFLLAINPTKILDRVGKILTPIFAVLIIVLIIFGVMKFNGSNPVADTYLTPSLAFGTGFIEGYNTLDALASVAFCIIAMSALKQLGFKDKKEFLSSVWIAGLVTAIGFSILYVGLGLLGNKFSISTEVLENTKVNKGAYVLSEAARGIFGNFGGIFLGIMVILTCFTTTVGLIVATSEFFNKKFPQFSYKIYTIIFTLVGFAIANIGLQDVIKFSIPMLLFLYPITITLVIIVIVNKYVALSKIGMQLTMGVVTLISILSVVGSTLEISLLTNIISKLPLAAQSLEWLVPVLICIIISLVLPNRQKGKIYDFGEL
ncbi:branched-chain amino acid transport system II carrier protein [Gemella cuniculi]|uniref:branched-chain amino acid transport system II carrier protein n=1 Tax=Gemella cuniculi TaxID=150240 RepID=UPI000425A55A|nr:branched-chain amino acid transport system II carrier protein [Gemella cuniculi]